MRNAAPKILVIGLDGAPYDLVKQWASSNELPTMARLMREGAWGRLDSVLPYQSVAAWSSFMTGLSPAEHGHFDFVTRMPASRTVLHVNSAESIRGTALWTLLGEAGKRVGVLNVPVTYPVRPVNGFMVPDWFTPSFAKNPTYPPELADDLRQRFGDYLFEFRCNPYELGRQSEAQFLQLLREVTQGRARSAMYLLDTHPWQFFMLVFTGPDTMQTFFWHYTDRSHPRHDTLAVSARGDEVLNYYRLLDEIIGEFQRRVPPETQIYILSDHGFGPLVKLFNANQFLADLGMLTLESGPMRHRERLLELIERVDVLNLRPRLSRRLRHHVFNWIMTPPVNWSRTRAYSGASTEGGIYITRRGRGNQPAVSPEQYEEVRETISRALLAVRDAETGAPIVERVYRKEQVYRGPFLAQMPDLLLVMAPGYELVESFVGQQMLLPVTRRRTGTHRREGIFIAWGPGVADKGELPPASLLDMAPTLLGAQGVEIPTAMSGQVLDIFDSDFRAARPLRYSDVVVAAAPRDSGWAPDEEAEVRERLRQLGYLE